MDLKKRMDFAISVAKQVGDFLLSHEELRRNVETKAENDYVTIADKQSENMIESAIKAEYPDDSILGEENGNITGKKPGRWIVDPIDGTVDFMTGFPNYTISIAYEDEKGLAVGVVYVVKQNEMFHACRGMGAYLNGVAIHTDEITPLKKQVALLVPPHRHHELLDSYIARMRKFYDYVSDMRSIGSAACSLCYVACGRCAAYYETALALYDCAAGIVIVNEAGGKVTLISDEEKWIDILASSSFCHEKLLEITND